MGMEMTGEPLSTPLADLVERLLAGTGVTPAYLAGWLDRDATPAHVVALEAGDPAAPHAAGALEALRAGWANAAGVRP